MFYIMSKAMEIDRDSNEVIHLELGDSSGYGNDRMKELIANRLRQSESLGYSPSSGEDELRSAFAEHYTRLCSHKFESENVAVTPANAAIFQVLNIISDRGDAILLPNPGFPTYNLAASYLEIDQLTYRLDESMLFEFDLDEINYLICSSNKIRALIINNPSNPLGLYHNVDILNKVIEICEKRNIYVVFDDTYRNLIYKPNYERIKHRDNVIYIYSISKDAAVPGMRIGCVVGTPLIVKKIAALNSLIYSCLPKFLQLAAADYLNEDHSRDRAALRSNIISRIDNVCLMLEKARGLTYVKPNAGIYFFLNISNTKMKATEFALELLNHTKVCVCPGDGFGKEGSDYVRICISGDESKLYIGIAKFIDFFNEKSNNQ